MSFLGTPGQHALPFRVPGFRGSRPIPRKQGIRRLLRRNVRRSRLSASALARTGAEHRPVATPKALLRAFRRFCISVLLFRLSPSFALWQLFSIGPRSARRGRADSFTVRAEADAGRGAFGVLGVSAGGGAVTPPLYRKTLRILCFVTA